MCKRYGAMHVLTSCHVHPLEIEVFLVVFLLGAFDFSYCIILSTFVYIYVALCA